MIAFRRPKCRQWIINKEMTHELHINEHKEKLIWTMERNGNTQGSSLASHSFNTLRDHEALNEAFIVDPGQFVLPDKQWEGMHTF